MKLYTIVLILILAMIIIPDVFFYLKLKNRKAKPLYIILHLIFPVFFTTFFLYIKFGLELMHNFRAVWWIMWLNFFFLIIYIPKILHIISYYINYLFNKKFNKNIPYINVLRITISSFIVIFMLVSAFITPNKFELTKHVVYVNNLPTGFDNYKIVQISDLHLGSWNNSSKRLNTAIKIINRENADIIVFTGDMVNNYAAETMGWDSCFLQMKAKNAKFAVLGNHDYGDYSDWENINERNKNKQDINQAIRNFGFHLLLNEHCYLRKGNDNLLLVGVENWGKNEKLRYSDLNKALANTNPNELKILLSHDPNHWEEEVLGRKDIFLTLSGHTHAAQAGIKIGNKLFSPAYFIFKYWAGLYNINNQYLYVNRGIGYIGLPMIMGVKPEITVITLKKR